MPARRSLHPARMGPEADFVVEVETSHSAPLTTFSTNPPQGNGPRVTQLCISTPGAKKKKEVDTKKIKGKRKDEAEKKVKLVLKIGSIPKTEISVNISNVHHRS